MPRWAALGWCWCLVASWSHVAEADSAWSESLSHGSVLGFPSYDEANRLLRDWVQRYKETFREQKIGTSYEKRPINAYVLGRANSRPHNCPQVLLTSLMHAREPASLTVLLYFAGRLLELYGQGDPQAVYVLETREVWLVPFVNPDGYIQNQGLRHKVIRKNRRPTCSRSSDSGVDINRNFGVHWSKEFALCNEEYQGVKPFSEPETQALKTLCEEKDFRAAVNFHSFGGMLTHPYNWAQKPQLPLDDQRIYDEVAKVFGWKKFGPAIKTVGYTAPGESDDWMYGARKIISMSPEVGPESGDFWPPAREIPGINRRNFERAMYVVRKAGLELAVEWTHRPARTSQLPGNATLLAGGPPQGELELRLDNRGLATSAGEALGVAVAGAAGLGLRGSAGREGAAALVLPEAGGSLPARLLPGGAGGGGGALTFQLPPLPRRSQSRLRLLTGRDWEPSGARSLQLCVAEVSAAAAGAARSVCHCGGLAQLPAASSREEVSAKPSLPAALVLASTEPGAKLEANQALCRAAASAGVVQPATAAAAAAANTGSVPSAAQPPARAPVGQGSAPGASLPAAAVPQAIAAVAAPPPHAAATRAAVLDPAFEASGVAESTAAVAVVAFGATVLTLSVCLCWQAALGHRLRPLVPTTTTAYRRPQAPPPVPPFEERAGRGTKVAPTGLDDDSTDLGASKV